MKINLLDDITMRKIGFSDSLEGHWYYCRDLGYEITFNLSLKKDGLEFKIDVIDDDFGQPYDYQYYLSKNPNDKFCLDIKKKVEDIILSLMNKGIVSEFQAGDYI